MELSIHDRLPYLNEDDDDIKSECDFELDMSPSVGTEPLDRDPNLRINSFNSNSNPDLSFVNPAGRRRITRKSKVELTPDQQLALDRAATRELVDQNTAVPHEVLHFHSHGDCSLCREVKQRRKYSRPIPEQFRYIVNQIFAKTDIDHIIMGDNRPRYSW